MGVFDNRETRIQIVYDSSVTLTRTGKDTFEVTLTGLNISEPKGNQKLNIGDSYTLNLPPILATYTE